MKVWKIAFPLLISAVLAGGTLLLLRGYVQYPGIIEDLSSWGAFFSVFGVIYAIVAGFLLVTVLNRYSSLHQTIEDELNAIESIRDFLLYLEDDQPSETMAMRHVLLNYAWSLSRTEWEEMTDPRTPMNSDTSEELYEIMRKGKALQVRKERDGIVLSALVANISDLTKLRTRRISLANERLPPRLKVLLVFMSVALVIAFLLMGVQGMFTHMFTLVSVSVSIHLLYMIIEDLDHPFYGIWNINRAPLDELVEKFEKDLTKK